MEGKKKVHILLWSITKHGRDRRFLFLIGRFLAHLTLGHVSYCHHFSSVVRPSVDKSYQLFTLEERRIPFIFDDFHFCRSRVIGLYMTENRIFTLCRMITWVVFLRMFWNFISSLPRKREGSLSFLVGTISNVLVMEIGWTDVGNGGIS